MNLFEKYQEKYINYIDSLTSDIDNIRKAIYDPSCPDYIKDTLFSTIRLLEDKFKDYQYQHHLILQNPQSYEKIMIQFLDNMN